MNKNINFIYKKLDEKLKNNKNFLIFKNFIDLYEEKNLYDDDFLLADIDLNLLKIDNDVKHFNKNNFKIFNNESIKNEQKIILLNGRFLYFENIDENIFIKESNSKILTDNGLNDVLNSLQNINLFYIINEILIDKFLCINIDNNNKKNRKLYIFNLYNDKLENKNFISNISFFLNYKFEMEIVEFNINFTKKNFINTNFYFYLNSLSNLKYSIFNYSAYNTPCSRSIYINQKKNTNFYLYENFNGNILSKIFYNCFLNGKNSTFEKKITTNLKNDSICKIDSKIFHYYNKSKSKFFLRSVVDNNAKFYSKCTINVDIDIKLIEANVKCDGLILSDNSEITFIPELDINSDNVKCNHGATIGYIDENILFYMMSRGLSKIECINSISKSFLLFDLNEQNFIYSFLNDEMLNNLL